MSPPPRRTASPTPSYSSPGPEARVSASPGATPTVRLVADLKQLQHMQTLLQASKEQVWPGSSCLLCWLWLGGLGEVL